MNPRPSRLHVVSARRRRPTGASGEVSIVLDTAWTPAAGERSDVVSVRPYFAVAVEREDLYATALATLDRWGRASVVADQALVDGVTYWFRAREDLWHWVHERLLWRHALTAHRCRLRAGGNHRSRAMRSRCSTWFGRSTEPLDVREDQTEERAAE